MSPIYFEFRTFSEGGHFGHDWHLFWAPSSSGWGQRLCTGLRHDRGDGPRWAQGASELGRLLRLLRVLHAHKKKRCLVYLPMWSRNSRTTAETCFILLLDKPKGPKLTEIVTGDLAHQDWPCGDIGGSQWWCCNLAGNARNSAGNGLLSPCVAGKLPLADQWSSKRPASSGPFWPSLSSYLLLQVILQGGCFQDFFVASFHRQGAEHQRRAVRCSLESGRQVAHSAEDITPPDLKKGTDLGFQ